jgi:hypothetical protein
VQEQASSAAASWSHVGEGGGWLGGSEVSGGGEDNEQWWAHQARVVSNDGIGLRVVEGAPTCSILRREALLAAASGGRARGGVGTWSVLGGGSCGSVRRRSLTGVGQADLTTGQVDAGCGTGEGSSRRGRGGVATKTK